MKRYKVRFHLAKGVNFMKWQVRDNKMNTVKYYEPSEVTLTMISCKLRNQPTTAKKINQGANKTVCSWIDAHEVLVSEHASTKPKSKDRDVIQYRYNPRVNPHWHTPSSSNVDNANVGVLQSSQRNLYGFADFA